MVKYAATAPTAMAIKSSGSNVPCVKYDPVFSKNGMPANHAGTAAAICGLIAVCCPSSTRLSSPHLIDIWRYDHENL